MTLSVMERTEHTPQEKLEWGLTYLQPIVNKKLIKPLLDYLALLEKWNRTYNLTAVRDPQEMVSTHLLDSLAILPHLPPGTLLDVGTGAGLPGIPLALACPDRPITLLDSNQKKTTFLRQAISELRLGNVNVVCERVERWAPPQRFDCIVSRAFADLADFANCTAHLLAADGTLVAMKGRFPEEELSKLPADFVLKRSIKLAVPGLEAERHLLLMGRA